MTKLQLILCVPLHNLLANLSTIVLVTPGVPHLIPINNKMINLCTTVHVYGKFLNLHVLFRTTPAPKNYDPTPSSVPNFWIPYICANVYKSYCVFIHPLENELTISCSMRFFKIGKFCLTLMIFRHLSLNNLTASSLLFN